MKREAIVVGVTGASGAPYAVRLIERLVRAGRDVSLIVTPAGRLVLADEATREPPAAARGSGTPGTGLDLEAFWPRDIADAVTYHPAERLDGPPASGSFATAACIVVPCSMNTLSALAHGRAENLLQRAGAVALKEGRPLVVVPREMPLTRIDLENMVRLASAGAIVMPAMPGFYHRPRKVGDLVDFVVAKVLDRLGIDHGLDVAWPGAGET